MRILLVLCIALLSSSFASASYESLVRYEQKKDTSYVIQVIKTKEYRDLQEAREKLNKINADKATFVEFVSPNHQLVVGYFNTLKEAEEFQQLIKGDFPASIIVPRVR